MTVFTLLVIGTGCSPDSTTSEEKGTSTETSESITPDIEESQEAEAKNRTPLSSEEVSKATSSDEETPIFGAHYKGRRKIGLFVIERKLDKDGSERKSLK